MFKIKNLGIKNKILLLVMISTTIVLSITILFFSINVRKNTIADSKKIADTETQKYASEIRYTLLSVFETTKNLSKSIIESRHIEKNLRDSLNKKILFRFLESNPDYLSVWLVWEIKTFDRAYKKKNGRILSTAYKLDNKLDFYSAIKDTTDQELDGVYYTYKKSKKPGITDPYYDLVTPELKDILMVSPISPLISNNEFCGVIGIDLSLERIQQIVKKINPLGSSTAYLVAANQTIVSHTDKAFYNKQFLQINKANEKEYSEALKFIKEEKTYSFATFKKDTGKEVYVSIAPVSFGESDKNWALVTETPLSEITKKSDNVFFITIIVGLIGLAILLSFLYFPVKRIVDKIVEVIQLADQISKGDLKSRISATNKDEIGQLANSINTMSEKLKQIVSDISASSEQINEVSRHISEYSGEISEGAGNQASSAEEIMASVEEMGANIHSNSENAKETEKISNKALEGIKNGSQSAHQTLDAIHAITSKVGVIGEISKQTNILALNAAIEAARAGQYGKGFSVVANEVKKLAEHAQEAADEINLISEKGVEISRLAEKDLSSLVPDVEKTAMLVMEITNASSEQSLGAEQIQNSIQLLNNIAQKNASLSDELNLKAIKLKKEVIELRKNIDYFNY